MPPLGFEPKSMSKIIVLPLNYSGKKNTELPLGVCRVTKAIVAVLLHNADCNLHTIILPCARAIMENYEYFFVEYIRRWSKRTDSNRHLHLGRVPCYLYTTFANWISLYWKGFWVFYNKLLKQLNLFSRLISDKRFFSQCSFLFVFLCSPYRPH